MSDPVLILADGRGRAEILPGRGGAVGRYDVRLAGRSVAIFQTAANPGRSGVLGLGCNLLVPFSNRLSGGGFRHAGRFHALAPSLPGATVPLHGNVLVEPWRVVAADGQVATLALDSVGPGPFRYSSEVRYGLRDGALEVALAVRNAGEAALPFGIGLHPWFVRSAATRVGFAAEGFWTEEADHLPLAHHAIGAGPWRGLAGRTGGGMAGGMALPDAWTNTAFTGWSGRARIDWPDRGAAVEIAAGPPFGTAMLYAPTPAVDFFCLEPVSHTVNAHNDRRPGSAAPRILAPGETLAGQVAFTPLALPG